MFYSRIAAFFLVVIFVPALIFASADMPGLAEKKAGAVKEVVAKPTISRVSTLPGLPVSSRQYEFLLDRPRLSMALAHICDPSLDLYKIEIRPDGICHVDDPSGLAGDMELVSSTPGKRIYFISGHYDILRMRFNGRMVLDTEYAEHSCLEGASVDSKAVSYVRVDSAFVGGFARLMAFLFPKKVDARIGRFSNAVKGVAVAVHNDPAGMYKRLVATGEFSPEDLREYSQMFLKKQEALR
jgi:hypothetical protein